MSINRKVAIILAALVLSACAASQQVFRAEPAAIPDCSPSQAAAKISEERLDDPGAAPFTIEIEVDGGDGLKLTSATRISGECAKSIQRRHSGLIGLRDGGSLRYEQDPAGRWMLNELQGPYEHPFAVDNVPVESRDMYRDRGLRFVNADRMSVPGFVGLWSGPAGSLIAAMPDPARRNFEPTVLLSTSHTVHGLVTHFPAIDSPAGTLTLMIDNGDGTLSSYGFQWVYSGLAGRK